MRRWLSLLGITATLALGLTVTAPVGTVQAAGLPGPINIFPGSLAASGATMTGNALLDFFAVMTYGAMQSPNAVSAATKTAAAAATGVPAALSEAEVAAKLAAKVKFRMPSVPLGGLTKVAGTVGTAVVGFQLGVSAGNGIGSAIIGHDSAGLICQSVTDAGGIAQGFIGFVSGADCAAFEATEAFQQQANQGITPGVSGGFSCAGTVCAELTGSGHDALGGYSSVPVWTWTVKNWADDYGAGAVTMWFKTPGYAGGGWHSSYEWAGSVDRGEAKDVTCRRAVGGVDTTKRCSYTTEVMPYRDSPLQYGFTEYLMSPGKPDAVTVGEQVVQTSANPTRTLKCIITGTDGIDYMASSDVFTEGGTTAGDPIATPVCPDLPEGVFPTHIRWTEEGGGETHILKDDDVTPEYAQATSMPECMDGSCLLVLNKGTKSCFDLAYECADWFTDPARESTYTCRWGSNAVALEKCTTYAPTFKPDAPTKGELYGDPTTGAPLKDPSQTGQADQTAQGSCFPTGWGIFNPFEWVQKPVGCALRAAFVPRTSVVNANAARIAGSFADSTPGKYVETITTLPILTAGFPTGCEGISVNMGFIPMLGLGTEHYLPACPGDFFAPWTVPVNIFLSVSFAIAGLFVIIRHLGRTFGFSGVDE